MHRRTFLKAAVASSAVLAAPRISSAQASKTLKFVPQADLAILDPIASSATVTRNHAGMVFDTLYGLDENYQPQPQMLEGHTVESDGRVWKLTLREGLKFHDNEPVRAQDVVASINRWAKRDLFGGTLMQRTDELSAVSDRVIQFRLKTPFAHLPAALGKIAPNTACIMPERLASTDASKPLTEMVGSGPYRFIAGEQVPGARVVYEKFAGYVPRADGSPGISSGPKVARIDRIEWQIIPDAGTAAAALQAGEVDWWEQPNPDLLPVLAGADGVSTRVTDSTGMVPVLRFNCLNPPFNNPAVRNVILRAVKQRDVMLAIAGGDASLWRENVGVFCPETPFASKAGIEVMGGTADFAALSKELVAAGYKGEKVVIMASSDIPSNLLSGEIVADVMKKLGMNVDLQVMDWGTVTQRRSNKGSVDQGGWSCFMVRFDGATLLNPATALITRGNGEKAWFGWPTSPELESLYEEWLAAPDLAKQQAVADRIQLQFFQIAPAMTLGQVLLPTAFRSNVTGILPGFPKFYNVDKA